MNVSKITITALQDGGGGIFKLSKPDIYNNPGTKTAAKALKAAVADTNLFCIDSFVKAEKKSPVDDLFDKLGITYKAHKLSEHITAYHPASASSMEAKNLISGDHAVNGIYY